MGITELYEQGLHQALEEFGTVELVELSPLTGEPNKL